MRRPLTFLSVGLLLIAVSVAAAPFRITIPLGDGHDVSPRCRPPIVSAWHRGPKDQLRLWAVTKGTGMSGFEVRGGVEPWCGERARRRLTFSLAVLALGVVGVVLDRRLKASRTVPT